MAQSGFQLNIRISNIDTNQPVAFKQDGKRFETSERTLKFCSNAKYKILLTSQPAADFHNLHFGGSDLELIGGPPNSGEYSAIWNTTGIDPSKRGARQDLLFVLTGPSGTLRTNIQTKFYENTDSHADYGHKLESLQWRCSVDGSGNISVINEEAK
ncbi:CB1 cannabinoid receptor-interacting protein 1 [Aphelenchoides bicaudatus]|nr:CB1 cannabinoid receptor-interacting protein 1 [Aphelenchoides bicaudatus]